MERWQLQDAKARMSELVKRAQQAPQDITVHGKSVAVLLSRQAYDRLAAEQESLLAFMQRSPLVDMDELSFERDRSPTRELAL